MVNKINDGFQKDTNGNNDAFTDLQKRVASLEQMMEERQEDPHTSFMGVRTSPQTEEAFDRLTGTLEKKVVEDVIRDRIAEIWWDDIFYITSVFESIDRYLVVADATVSTAGLSLSLGSGACSATLQAKDNNPIKADRKTYFSSPVGIHGIIDAAYQVGILDDAVYFKISEGVITGHTNDGTEASVSLGSVGNNTPVLLECVYYPQYKVDFYIDGEIKGTLTSNIIAPNDTISNIVSFSLDPNSAADSNNFTADAGTDIITLSAGSWLADNVPVTLTTTGTLPGGLSTSTVYWLVNTSGGTSGQLSATEGGSAIDITSAGTGTHTITRDTTTAEITHFQLLQKK